MATPITHTSLQSRSGDVPGAADIITRKASLPDSKEAPRPLTSRPAEDRATLDLVLRALQANHFAVISTVDADGSPDSAAVSYGAAAPGPELALYVMTRRHLQKARNIAQNPRVSMVVPVQRRLLRFIPPATIQLRGTAEILDWTDPAGTAVFRRFWMGRRILGLYETSRRRGDTRVCFLKITLDPVIGMYALGRSVWDIRRRMESSGAKVRWVATGVAGDRGAFTR